MTSAERHFLTCQDSNCERAYCVARRDLEHQVEDIKLIQCIAEKVGPFFKGLVEQKHEGALALHKEIQDFIDETERLKNG